LYIFEGRVGPPAAIFLTTYCEWILMLRFSLAPNHTVLCFLRYVEKSRFTCLRKETHLPFQASVTCMFDKAKVRPNFTRLCFCTSCFKRKHFPRNNSALYSTLQNMIHLRENTRKSTWLPSSFFRLFESNLSSWTELSLTILILHHELSS